MRGTGLDEVVSGYFNKPGLVLFFPLSLNSGDTQLPLKREPASEFKLTFWGEILTEFL